MNADIVEQLKQLDAGDDVIITVKKDSESLDLHVHVVDCYYTPPEKDAYGWVKGELEVHTEATDETVHELDLPTHSITIFGKEKQPNKWSKFDITIWDPETNGNTVIRDRYTSLGDIQDITIQPNQ